MSKYNFINDAIKIDFPISKLLQNTIEEAESLDLNKDIEYFCVAESIDVIAKGLFASGKINKEQWDKLCLRYPVQ